VIDKAGDFSRPVFISYATADRKQALAVCKSLERRDIDCWISTRDVPPGANYQEAIVRAIREARAMVLVFSEAANNSDEIKKELSLASRHHLPVMALRIDDVEPSDAFAYELSTRQWIDACDGWERGMDALKRQLQNAPPIPATAPLEPAAPQRHARPRSRRNIIVAAAILFILLGAAALFYLSGSIGGQRRVSLAVLPFADLSPAHDKAYFAEGIGEEILSSLGREKGLKVLGRTSAAQIQPNADPRSIRKALGVTHLLEGSTRTAGDALRVNVRLVDTRDGSSLWEEEYQGRLADVFAVQDKIAASVVQRLRGTLVRAPAPAESTNVRAYQDYLAARALMRSRTKDDLTKALALAGKVISSDPRYAPGQALYAELVWLLSDDPNSYGAIPAQKARALALPHAREAIRLAPDQAEGYAALGLILRAGAIAALQHAVRLDPARGELRVWLGVALTAAERHDEAYAAYAAAAETEPLWPVAINRLTQTLAASGKTDEATEVVRQYRARGGSAAQASRFMAIIARARDDLSAAAAADRAAMKDPKTPYVAEWLAREYALLGLRDRAAAVAPRRNGFQRLFVAGQWDELRRSALEAGTQAWSDPDVDFAIFALGAARDWNGLARLYRSRNAAFADYCNADPHSVPVLVLALNATGERPAAKRLWDCAMQRSRTAMSMKFSSPNAEPGRLQFRIASLLAVAGDKRAMDWLTQAVQRGWLGQYYSPRLSDWPQFDGLRADPRYAALQKRIDATIARERAETGR
jgi:TolB-like protein